VGQGVAGVQSAAQTGLAAKDVHARIPGQRQRCRRERLEPARLVLVHERTQRLHGPAEIIARDRNIVDRNTLVDLHQVGTRIAGDTQARILEQPGQQARGAALAVGTGGDQDLVIALGVADLVEQSADASQAGANAPAVQGEKPAGGFVVGSKGRRGALTDTRLARIGNIRVRLGIAIGHLSRGKVAWRKRRARPQTNSEPVPGSPSCPCDRQSCRSCRVPSGTRTTGNPRGVRC